MPTDSRHLEPLTRRQAQFCRDASRLMHKIPRPSMTPVRQSDGSSRPWPTAIGSKACRCGRGVAGVCDKLRHSSWESVAAAQTTAGSVTNMPLFGASEFAVMFVRTPLGPNTFTGLEVVRVEEASDNRGPAFEHGAVYASHPGSHGSQFSDQVVLIRAPYRILCWARSRMKGHLARRSFPGRFCVSVRDSAASRTVAMPMSTVARAELPPPARPRRQWQSAFTVQGSDPKAA
jgi:hypothetical protein